jgi:hypothetical protein
VGRHLRWLADDKAHVGYVPEERFPPTTRLRLQRRRYLVADLSGGTQDISAPVE